MPIVSFLDQPVASFQNFLRDQRALQLRAIENSRFREPALRAEIAEREARTAESRARTKVLEAPKASDPLANLKRIKAEQDILKQQADIRVINLNRQLKEMELEEGIFDTETGKIKIKQLRTDLQKTEGEVKVLLANEKRILAAIKRADIKAKQKPQLPSKQVFEEIDTYLLRRFINEKPRDTIANILNRNPKTPSEFRAMLPKKEQELWLDMRRDLANLADENKPFQQTIDEFEALSNQQSVIDPKFRQEVLGDLLPAGQGGDTQTLPIGQPGASSGGVSAPQLPQGTLIDTTLKLPGGVEVYNLRDGRRGFISPANGEFKILPEEQ